MKYKISDFVIRDDVIEFPDTETTTLGPTGNDGITFFASPDIENSREFPRIAGKGVLNGLVSVSKFSSKK